MIYFGLGGKFLFGWGVIRMNLFCLGGRCFFVVFFYFFVFFGFFFFFCLLLCFVFCFVLFFGVLFYL